MKYSISVIDKSTGEIVRSFEMVRSMPANECERCIKINLSFLLPVLFQEKSYCLSIDPINVPKDNINLSELPLIF